MQVSILSCSVVGGYTAVSVSADESVWKPAEGSTYNPSDPLRQLFRAAAAGGPTDRTKCGTSFPLIRLSPIPFRRVLVCWQLARRFGGGGDNCGHHRAGQGWRRGEPFHSIRFDVLLR